MIESSEINTLIMNNIIFNRNIYKKKTIYMFSIVREVEYEKKICEFFNSKHVCTSQRA